MRPDNWRDLGLGTAPQRLVGKCQRVGSCLEYSGSSQIRISAGGHCWTMATYQVAWLAAGRAFPENMLIQRKCGNLACVELSHLVLTERSDGAVSPKARERMVVGHHRASVKRRTLTKRQVAAIRDRVAAGETVYHLADRFGVSPGTIYGVANRFIYRELGETKPDRIPRGQYRRTLRNRKGWFDEAG